MIVCIVSHSGDLAGAEMSLVEAATALQRAGVECIVVVPTRGPLAAELGRRGIRCYRLLYTWWVSPRVTRVRTAAKLLINLLSSVVLALRFRLWRIDVVYTNSITVCVGALAARCAGVPHVWQPREFGKEDYGLDFDLGARVSFRVVEQYSKACIVASDSLAAHYRKLLPGTPIHLLRQGVRRPARAAGANTAVNPFRFVIIGTLRESKGQHDALRAFLSLVSEGRDVELIIAGSGDAAYEAALKTLAGGSKRVVFAGQVLDVDSMLASCHCALMCSRQEAFGRATIEAMLAGLPVIGARAGATPELVEHGHTGLLYAPGSVSELLDRMRSLVLRPDEALRMGRNARVWAERTFADHSYSANLTAILSDVARDASVLQDVRRTEGAA